MDELKKIVPFLGFNLVGLSEVSYTEGIDPNASDTCKTECEKCSSSCITCKHCCSAGSK